MKKIFILLIILCPVYTRAENVRVFYDSDGISIMSLLPGMCDQLSEKDCLDREENKTKSLQGLPHVDIPRSTIPLNRLDRDKWRYNQSQGIYVDTTLVTKTEKIAEYESKLDAELVKESPDYLQIVKLQRLRDKVGRIETKTDVIPPEKLAEFQSQNSNLLGSMLGAVKKTLNRIIKIFK